MGFFIGRVKENDVLLPFQRQVIQNGGNRVGVGIDKHDRMIVRHILQRHGDHQV